VKREKPRRPEQRIHAKILLLGLVSLVGKERDTPEPLDWGGRLSWGANWRAENLDGMKWGDGTSDPRKGILRWGFEDTET